MSEVRAELPPDFSRRLIHFVTERLNRRYPVRDAVGAALKDCADSYGGDVALRVTEETFERLVSYFAGALDAHREAEERGAIAVAEGVHVDLVDHPGLIPQPVGKKEG